MTLPTLERLDLLARTPTSVVMFAVFDSAGKKVGRSFALTQRAVSFARSNAPLSYEVSRSAYEALQALCGDSVADDIETRKSVMTSALKRAAELQPDYFAH